MNSSVGQIDNYFKQLEMLFAAQHTVGGSILSPKLAPMQNCVQSASFFIQLISSPNLQSKQQMANNRPEHSKTSIFFFCLPVNRYTRPDKRRPTELSAVDLHATDGP